MPPFEPAPSARERALRAALEACLLSDERDLERLTAAHHQIATDLHTLSGSITSVSLTAEMVALAMKRTDLGELGPNLVDALGRMRRLTEQMKESLRAAQVERDPVVDPAPVAVQAFEDFKARHPTLQWRWTDRVRQPATVRVRGGADGVRRILEPLLQNAIEGDGGTRAAQAIEVIVRAMPGRQQYWIEIQDDGPGFAAALLQTPLTPFHSAKSDRLGLGLLTAQRIACASGGALDLENRSPTGALVRVILPFVAFGESPDTTTPAP